jgi:tRNA-specific 2-thiouridylase
MEKTRKKPLLVGLSGGLDSFVAAYLMKIQKIDLYGVMIANTPESMQEMGESIFACHQSEARIEQVKKICDHLQMPLTVVRAREQFQDSVIDGWLNAKVELSKPRACHDCHRLRMEILFQKMKELGCDGIVTGHYAKLIRPTPDARVSVHTSNDPAFDQSGLLMSLDQAILNKLTLPLSDLQKKEVIKIAESFELRPPEKTMSFGKCLPVTLEVTQMASKLIAGSLLGEGDLTWKDQPIARHHGFHGLEFGADYLPPQARAGEVPKTIIGSVWNDNKVILGAQDYFQDKGAFLVNCHWGSDVDGMKPFKGYIHTTEGASLAVYVYPKQLRAASLEVSEGELRFTPGETISVFNRKGKNAKLLVTGFIQGPSKHYPDNTLSLEVRGERGPETAVVDKDFNF